jgi:hypothetical protein
MTVVVALGNCACDALPWRYRGQLRLTAIVKASFALGTDGALSPCAPDAIHRVDQPHPSDQTTLVAASDRVPYRACADVLVVGRVLPPPGGPTPRLVVGASDGPLIDKRLDATGSGPISAEAAARRALLAPASRLGVDDAVMELADSFNWSYFQTAPAGQQARYLAGDETLLLEGLCPQAPRLSATLPRVQAAAALWGPPQWNGGARQLVGLAADCLLIDVERLVCSITWRGTVGVPNDVALADLTLAGAIALGGTPVALPETAPSPAAVSPPKARPAERDALTGTVGLSATKNVPGVALPFADRSTSGGWQRAAQPASGEPSARARGRASPWAPKKAKSAATSNDVVPDAADDAGRSADASERPAPRRAADSLGGTVELSGTTNVAGVALPFATRAKVAEPAPPPGPIDPAPPAPPAPTAAPANVVAAMPIRAAAPVTWTDPPVEPRSDPTPVPQAAPAPAPAPRRPPVAALDATAQPALQLLWLDPAALVRLRAHPEYRALLDAAAERAPDAEVRSYARTSAAGNVDGYRDVLTVLAGARPRAPSELGAAIDGAIRDGNKLIPPLVVVGGELAIAFDERAELGATADVAAAICPGHDDVAQAVAAARTYLESTSLGVPRVTSVLGGRIRDAVLAAQSDTDALELQHQIERTLVTGRSYRRRTLFGGTYLAGTLRPSSATATMTVYVRDTASGELPLLEHFAARILAELHPSQEPEPASLLALRIVAVARLLPRAQPS